MAIMKTAVIATVAATMALGATMSAANAGPRKKDVRNFLYGAAAVTAVVAVAKQDCKKWKHRYNRTGDLYYLDRYYACI